jgi:arylsulfatase A
MYTDPLPRHHIMQGSFEMKTQCHSMTTHRSMTVIVCGIVALWNVLPGTSVGIAATGRPPNVIVIMADDQGSVDLGCYGAIDLQTPAVDGLAKRGVRFTQFYAAAPVCSPSRAGLLTGRYPLRAGLVSNASPPPVNGDFSDGACGLPAEQITLAEMFKAAGYATAHIGKWHLGYAKGMTPNEQGFDYSFGFLDGCIDNYSHFFYWAGPNRHDLWRNGKEVFYDGQFFPELMVKEAGQFMEKNRDRSFFMYFAVNMPHYPYQGYDKWLQYYKQLPYPRQLYAAFVSTLDENVGHLLKYVDQLGLRDKTIIVYQSDNGHSTEERGHFGGGSAGPYRGAKFSLFEGGIRLPAIISWPDHLPQGQARAQLAHGCDWMPTLAELTGVKLVNPDIDGKSLVKVIQSAESPTPHEAVFWEVGAGQTPQWAVRLDDWKLIGNVVDTSERRRGFKLSNADKKLFLSNLAKDVGETHNYAADNPDVSTRLKSLYERWLKQCGRIERQGN